MILSLAAAIAMAATLVLPVSATEIGGGSVQPYAADKPLDNGTIVQLTGKNASTVTTATKAKLQNMFGVTVDRSQLSITLTNDNLQNEVYVAASGTYNVLVSTEGGTIKPSDYVTMSSIDGVAMKADAKAPTVFGRANATFDGTDVTLGTTTLKDASGKATKTVKIGMIPVTIDIKHNPNIKSTKVNLPQMLQRVGQQIAEKQVSPIRIYLSMAITAASILAAIIMLYGGVRSGMISIGRNPMSKKSIFKGLFSVILASILILIIGLFAVYLLLKL